MKRIVIFIPAYNEERSIGSVVLQAKRFGNVYVVDDGSSDGTAKIAEDAGAEVIKRAENGGYGAALKTGFETAKKIASDAFVFMDADFQHDPMEIPKVAAPVLSGAADVCIGSRFQGKFVSPPAGRVGGVSMLNRIAGIHAGSKAIDFQSGFRAYSKKALKKISFHEEGMAAGSEIIVSALRASLKVLEVPVAVRYYRDDNSRAVAQGVGLLSYIVGAIAKREPLFYFSGTGFVLLLTSGIVGLFVANTFYSKGVLPVGSAFLTIFFGIIGLVLISIGINLYTLEVVLKKYGRGGF